MVMREDGGGDKEDNWWESWKHRRRMAMAEVLCYVVYTICIFCVNYDRQCADAAESRRAKKRKAHAREREFDSLGEAIGTVVEAIREGDATMECCWQHAYSEEKVFAELLNIGVKQHVRYRACNFLVEDPARARAFVGYPVEERKNYLLLMIYDP